MKKLMLWVVALGVLAGSALRAQELTGNWQGTLKGDHGEKDQRLILVVTKEAGMLAAKLYSIDETPQPFRVSSIAQEGAAVTFAIATNGAAFEGKLNDAGTAITGTWTHEVTRQPMEFARPAKDAAWEIPAPPAPRRQMPADAQPEIDVATIKPNDSGGHSMDTLTFRGRHLITVNSSLADLMMFAYRVQRKQIVGAPDWIEKDRYDVDATPDVDGTPTADQVRIMIRNLLATRFQLKFHEDKREMPAFVLSVAKEGSKLQPTQPNGNLHGIGMQPAATGALLFAYNAPVRAFADFLQSLVLDRPVVDRTGLTGRYDMAVTLTLDDSLFNGHPPEFPKPAEGVEPAPHLFEAIQQQLGLKLTAEKTMVDVMVVDRVEKPSAN